MTLESCIFPNGPPDPLQKAIPSEQTEACSAIVGTTDGLHRGTLQRVSPLETELERGSLKIELQSRRRQQQAVADLSQVALVRGDFRNVLNAAMEIVTKLLECQLAEILSSRGGSTLRREACHGWETDKGGAVDSGCCDATVARHVLDSGQPVVIDDLASDLRFDSTSRLRQHGVMSGVLVAIPTPYRSGGILGVYSTQPTSFSEDDLAFLTAIANVLGSTLEIDRLRHAIETLVDTTPDIVARFDHDLRFTAANENLALTVDMPAGALLGRSVRELGLLPYPEIDLWEICAQAAMRCGSERSLELRAPTTHGERDFQIRLVPDREPGADTTSMLVIARDISDERQAIAQYSAIQQELRERDAQLAELTHPRRDPGLIGSQLTPEEIEILRLLASGLTDHQIAARLNLSSGTEPD